MQAYLDNSATTQPTEGVISAMEQCMREGFYNPSSLYAPAIEAEKRMAECRKAIQAAIGGSGGDIYFTSGGTEANHLAIEGVLRSLRAPRRALISAVEHPSVQMAAETWRQAGCAVDQIPVDSAGQLDWAWLEAALREGADLVSCMQVNNETGAILDADRLSGLVRSLAPECRLHIDGVQGFLRVPTDVKKCDLYTLSGHKIHGPKGIGALYVKKGVRLVPFMTGGGQEKGMRSGTENTPGIAGFLAAIEEMRAVSDIGGLLMGKKKLLADAFRAAVPDMEINGPGLEEGAPHIVNIRFPGVRGEVLLHALEGAGVYCSTGSACSSKKRKVSPVLLAMGIPPQAAEGALRFSLSAHTRDEEIMYAAEQLGKIYPTLRRYQRR